MFEERFFTHKKCIIAYTAAWNLLFGRGLTTWAPAGIGHSL